jgi:hypothetical protein
VKRDIVKSRVVPAAVEHWQKVFKVLHINCRKIRLIEGNAKCRHLKELTCKGTLRQVFIRVYRLQIANFLFKFSYVGILPALGSVRPSPLLSGSTLPPLPYLCE